MKMFKTRAATLDTYYQKQLDDIHTKIALSRDSMRLQRVDEGGIELRYVEEGKYYSHAGLTGASHIVPDTGDAALSAVLRALLEHHGLEAVLEVPLASNGLQWGLRSGPNEIVRLRKLPKVKAP